MANKAAQNSGPANDAAKPDERNAFEIICDTIALGMIEAGDLTPEERDAEGFNLVTAVFDTLNAKDAALATLKRQLAATKGVATRAKNELAATVAEYEPRKIGPIDADGDEPGYSAAELFELALSADTVEIAFSDGEAECGPPLALDSGQELVPVRGKLRLRAQSVIVHGPEAGKPPRTIAGFALMLDGEQVAWSRRYEPLRVGPGQQVQMAEEIVF